MYMYIIYKLVDYVYWDMCTYTCTCTCICTSIVDII